MTTRARTGASDAVILAVPAPRLAELVGDIAPRAAAAAARIPVASAVVLAMAVPGGTPFPPQSGVLVASGERLHTKAITLSTRKWGSRGNAELLRMSFGRFGDDVAPAHVRRGPARTLPSRICTRCSASPSTRSMSWCTGGSMRCPNTAPGHGELAADLRTGLPPTMAIAGNYIDGVGVPACVAAAGRAAAAVVAATTRR